MQRPELPRGPSSKDQPGSISGLNGIPPGFGSTNALWLNLNTGSSADFRADVTAAVKMYSVKEAVGRL